MAAKQSSQTAAKQSSQMTETLVEKIARPKTFASQKRFGWWPLAIEWTLYAALMISVFLFGGGFVEGYTLLEATALLLIGILFVGRLAENPFSVKPRFDLVLFILFVWMLFLLVQLIPFPTAFIRTISPNMAALWEQFHPFSNHFDRMTFSLGTYGTRVEIGKTYSYGAFFLIAYFLFREKSAIKRLGIAAVMTGTLLSIVGLVFFKIDSHKLYGALSFEQAASFTPYLNKNHFANYLVMTLPVTLALACLMLNRSSLFTAHRFRSKLLWLSSPGATGFFALIGCFILQFAAFLYPASRGAFLGFLFAMSVFCFLLLSRARGKLTGFIMVAFLASVIGLGMAQAKPLISRLKFMSERPSEDMALQFRLSNWKASLKMFLDFPAAGFGAGGFHSLFPKYKTLPEDSSTSQVRFYHAENELLETLGEEGVIGTGLLLALGILLTARFIKRWRRLESVTLRWLTLGMVSACFGMLGQSLVDFPLHIPANAALFAVFAGVLARAAHSGDMDFEGTPSSSNRFLLSRLITGVLAAAVVSGGLYFTFPFLWHQWRSEFFYLKAKDELNEISRQGSVTLGRVLSAYDYLVKAKKSGTEQARIHYALGRTCFYFGMLARENSSKRTAWFVEAEGSFQKALSLEPFDAGHQYGLGELYSRWGKRKEAEPYFERASFLEPQNPFYHFQFGRNQLELGKIGPAYSIFRQVLEINQAYADPILALLLESNPKMTLEEFDRLTPQGKHQRAVHEQFASFLTRRGLTSLASAVRMLN